MTEQPLDLRRVGRALARGKWVLALWAAVGLVLALAFTLVRPPSQVARSQVLLPASSVDSTGQPTRNINTEVQIADSGDVLTLAAADLHPAISVRALRNHVHVTAPTPDILEFTARADSPKQAIAIANAVTHGYRLYSAGATSDLLRQVVGPLQTNLTQLRSQIAGLQRQIDAASASLQSAPKNSARANDLSSLLTSLRSQQNDASTQLVDVQNQISQAQLNTNVDSSGIRVLEQATNASDSATATAARNLGLGLLIGLLVGATIVLGREARDRRLRLRDDIARAAGAPIIASIATRDPRDADEWRALFEVYEPSADEGWSLRRSVRSLVADAGLPARVLIVTMVGDGAAIAVAPQFAVFAASAGIRTLLVVSGRDPAAATLREACRSGDLAREPVRPNLWVKEARPGQRVDSESAQLVITAVIADHGGIDVDPDVPSSVLFGVSAGEATPERIGEVAAAAADARRPIVGVIVANPEPTDTTAGRVTDGLVSARSVPSRFIRTQRGSAS